MSRQAAPRALAAAPSLAYPVPMSSAAMTPEMTTASMPGSGNVRQVESLASGV
jgi:hypothetical protein